MVVPAPMGTADREYNRGSWKPGGGFLADLTPVVRFLLIANVVIYLVDTLLLGKQLREWGSFSIDSALRSGHIWELLTFQFLHGSLGHILANSLALYFFGPWLERHWGTRRFIAFYLLCGLAGVLFFSLLAMLNVFGPSGYYVPLVGASAGIYGILAGAALVAPQERVRLWFPPITLTMRQLALGLLAISAVMILLPFGLNRGGEAGHLGGAVLGFFLVRHPWLLKWAGEGEAAVTIERPKAFRRRTQSKLRPRTKVDLDRATAVDKILDKISQHGFQSLTDKERELLLQASKSQRGE